MFQLTEQEWAALQASDERNFVLTVKADILRAMPALSDDPHLATRLKAAFDETKRLGFNDDRNVVQFLHLEAIVPGFYQQPGIAAWLARNGKGSDERFDMLMSVVRKKQGG